MVVQERHGGRSSIKLYFDKPSGRSCGRCAAPIRISAGTDTVDYRDYRMSPELSEAAVHVVPMATPVRCTTDFCRTNVPIDASKFNQPTPWRHANMVQDVEGEGGEPIVLFAHSFHFARSPARSTSVPLTNTL